MTLYKYSGAGNDFVVLDGRGADVSEFRTAERVSALCDRNSGFVAADGRVGADGLMILSESADHDFRMEYFNSDGSSGMMCGNGGRCIVAFADFVGVKPSDGNVFVFEAADGLHTGEIVSRDPARVQVRLKMIDVQEFRPVLGGWFLDTGTRHFVLPVEDVEAVDVETEGRRYRWDPEFAPVGANVNFISFFEEGLKVRTFEKGVEAETLACGTGITASAICAHLLGRPASHILGSGALSYRVFARRDELSVDFVPCSDTFRDVYLTGPAERIG